MVLKGRQMKDIRKLPIHECSGTPYEIGKQYGAACRDNIVKSISELIANIGMMRKVSKAEILANTRKYLPSVERFDPELIEMMKGQAEGAGVLFDEIFMLMCRFELGIYYQRVTCLCTSFGATGKATKGGKTIIGQNFDLNAGLSIDLVKKKYSNNLEQLSLVFGGACEVLLNSAGLAMTLNVMLSPVNDQILNVPCCCVISKAMRQKRIGDALGVVCASGRSILNYTFASAEGDIIAIETRPDDFNVLYTEGDMLVHSNHYLTERLKRGDGTFGLMEGDSYIRVQRIKRLMERHYGDLTVELMMEFMADHNNYPNSICAHMNPQMPRGETLASLIMVPEDKVMYVTWGQPCRYEYEEYRL
jgi:isopenicillin-N N-acyltransferase-like protein